MTGTSMKTLRADARRNREQIVEAARLLFVERGPDVPMEEVARAAGVGVGTLYRRFPDRGELLTAVALDVFERLSAMAGEAAAGEPDAWTALQRFLKGWAEFRLGLLQDALCAGMPAAVAANKDLQRARETWLEQFEGLITAAQAEGALREDVTLTEIAVFMNMLIRGEPTPADEMILHVMLDGLHR
ncbi:helix-turn-helix domain-containing protein [Actinocrispum sp. NPDC049592]|uniref:TetR/AcrR family transcriptional regulator n=1 Tax=Actinocrispum sp. NPDC049592 TaxID=3154835 RepID=UPI00343173DD